MANSNAPARVNGILLVLVGLLVGLIAGYLIGVKSGFVNANVMTQATRLNDIIASDNAWIVDGLTCPMPGCMNPLAVCQSDVSRRIRAWVNEQLALGRPGDDIRAEIIRVHGANVLKTAQGAPPDTQDTP